jgi:2-O-methyltransferase
MNIRDWVTDKFSGPAPKVFFEIGANEGQDTEWMAALPNVVIHAFEPEPRCLQLLKASLPPNVVLRPWAVGATEELRDFYPSLDYAGGPWTQSGSIRRPTEHHFARYPVSFSDPYPVWTCSLDWYWTTVPGAPIIDFIWADMQGAEGDMVRGGQRSLARTRYLYVEVSDVPYYEGQMSYGDVLATLPGEWRVIAKWPDDVLVENVSLNSGRSQ